MPPSANKHYTCLPSSLWLLMIQGDKRRQRASRERIHLFHYQLYNSVWHSQRLALILVCGYAFCERLNPLLSNDAFMSSISSFPSLPLPPSCSPLIKRKRQYASDIKRHQSPQTVYLPCFLSFTLSLFFLVFFFFLSCTRITCLQMLFDVEQEQTMLLCVCVCVLLYRQMYCPDLRSNQSTIHPCEWTFHSRT